MAVIRPIMPAFIHCPNEAAIIGRLLAGYGDLEFSLCHLVRWVIGDQDSAFKALFRTRGETQRIDIADALMRQRVIDAGHETAYGMTISNMRFCLKIRNQFAHCHWLVQPELELHFIDMEEQAGRGNNQILDLAALTQFRIAVPTLQEQEEFFRLTDEGLGYLIYEFQILAGILTKNLFEAPKPLSRPPLHTP